MLKSIDNKFKIQKLEAISIFQTPGYSPNPDDSNIVVSKSEHDFPAMQSKTQENEIRWLQEELSSNNNSTDKLRKEVKNILHEVNKKANYIWLKILNLKTLFTRYKAEINNLLRCQ